LQRTGQMHLRSRRPATKPAPEGQLMLEGLT
jgi:hypothetical protein